MLGVLTCVARHGCRAGDDAAVAGALGAMAGGGHPTAVAYRAGSDVRDARGIDEAVHAVGNLLAHQLRVDHPEQAGLPVYGQRRVPGLRRGEVAMLAGVSVEYYIRLERGNLKGVSDSVLDALARALRLDDTERMHLYDLARAAGSAPQARARQREAQPTVRQPPTFWTRPQRTPHEPHGRPRRGPARWTLGQCDADHWRDGRIPLNVSGRPRRRSQRPFGVWG